MLRPEGTSPSFSVAPPGSPPIHGCGDQGKHNFRGAPSSVVVTLNSWKPTGALRFAWSPLLRSLFSTNLCHNPTDDKTSAGRTGWEELAAELDISLVRLLFSI
jgi:hypothetical protein